jgi:4-hydroxyproline epimerase
MPKTAGQHRIRIIDSHTGGEPTRVVLAGGPPLGNGTLAEQREVFRRDYDRFRSAVVNEPRGADAIVGAILCEPSDARCQFGVIFFNNVGYLNMCGHGTIGLIVTLAYLGRIEPGLTWIDTPVGPVAAELHATGAVTFRNVPSYRYAKDITIPLEGFGPVTGDIAWGGNWFFQAKGASPVDLDLENLDVLTDFSWRIRQALERSRITGKDGGVIDHIELFAAPRNSAAHSRNFVLCPGRSYDRSPCGTGTSAKLACLYADGKLAAGETFVQESITGSLFEGKVEIADGQIIPVITGTAFVTSEAELIVDERDPFAWGIPLGQ